VLSGALL